MAEKLWLANILDFPKLEMMSWCIYWYLHMFHIFFKYGQ